MCVTCGCSGGNDVTLTNIETGKTTDINGHHTHTLADGTVISHNHDHGHEDNHNNHGHNHAHEHAKIHGTTITLEEKILQKNNLIAAENRGYFKGRNILALNLVSSPGSGKTTLLTRTINDLKERININVIEGDQETVNDAQRIKETGCKVVQINTGTGCHLEAAMVENGYNELN
ncbi:MAG: GTP-binding protein, partial [Crocosphaera sp.]